LSAGNCQTVYQGKQKSLFPLQKHAFENFGTKKVSYFISTEYTANRILAVFRNWKNKQTSSDIERIKSLLKEKLSSDNHSTLE
jgi:hypothetical protein